MDLFNGSQCQQIHPKGQSERGVCRTIVPEVDGRPSFESHYSLYHNVQADPNSDTNHGHEETKNGEIPADSKTMAGHGSRGTFRVVEMAREYHQPFPVVFSERHVVAMVVQCCRHVESIDPVD